MMQNNNMPPKSPFQQIMEQTYVNAQFNAQKEPNIVFISHDLSKRMRVELEKKNMTFEAFVTLACIEYINKIANEKVSFEQYLNFSDLRITDNVSQLQSNSANESNNSDPLTSISLSDNSNGIRPSVLLTTHYPDKRKTLPIPIESNTRRTSKKVKTLAVSKKDSK